MRKKTCFPKNDTGLCHRLWQDDFVNRAQCDDIPQSLSTLMFCRWSEVLSGVGVLGDSLSKKERKKKKKDLLYNVTTSGSVISRVQVVNWLVSMS